MDQKREPCFLPEETMINNILSYEEFVNESRIPIAWAKPSNTAIKVLSFIGEKEKVTKRELTEFLDSVPEDASGKKPSMNWVRGQKKYIKYKVQEEEANYFSLTPLGKRVLKVSTVNG
jgi:hypothetical protein